MIQGTGAGAVGIVGSIDDAGEGCITQINQLDSPGRASLLAGGLRGSIALIFGSIDALHAIGAFLHHATAAEGDLRIMWARGFLALLLGVIPKVEYACVVGAGSGAITRSPAAGINHGAQAGRGMYCGVHRANGLTRCFLALTASGGHIMQAVRRVQITSYSQLLQISPILLLCRPNGRYIIFGTASKGTRPATNAARKVYQHSPLWRSSLCMHRRR